MLINQNLKNGQAVCFKKKLWIVARFQTVLCQNFNCIPLEPNFGQTHLTTNDRLVQHRTRLMAHRK